MNGRTKPALFGAFLILSAPLLLWAQQKVQIKTENGVVTVVNPEEPNPPPGFPSEMKLEKELVIGKANGPDEYLFGQARGVAVDHLGRIFVLDSKLTLIRIYDRDGNYLKTIGRRGQGPGELQTPQLIFSTSQNEIMIEDHSPRQFVFYSLAGDFLRNVSFASAFIFTTGIDSLGNLIGIVQTPGPNGNIQVLSRYSPKFEYMHTVGYPIEFNRGTYNYFKPWLRWAVFKGDHIIFGFSEKYELLIYDGEGCLVKKIYKTYDPVRISAPELAKMRAVVRLSSAIRLIVPKYHTAFQTFTVDDENRIFVQTWERTRNGKGYIYDVFDSKGICVARIPMEAVPRVWKNGKVYTIEEDENGYQYVVRYKVIWH